MDVELLLLFASLFTFKFLVLSLALKLASELLMKLTLLVLTIVVYASVAVRLQLGRVSYSGVRLVRLHLAVIILDYRGRTLNIIVQLSSCLRSWVMVLALLVFLIEGRSLVALGVRSIPSWLDLVTATHRCRLLSLLASWCFLVASWCGWGCSYVAITFSVVGSRNYSRMLLFLVGIPSSVRNEVSDILVELRSMSWRDAALS